MEMKTLQIVCRKEILYCDKTILYQHMEEAQKEKKQQKKTNTKGGKSLRQTQRLRSLAESFQLGKEYAVTWDMNNSYNSESKDSVVVSAIRLPIDYVQAVIWYILPIERR